ncbi:MAG: hypothetical protein ABIZ04_05245 [Opitutus sp.]
MTISHANSSDPDRSGADLDLQIFRFLAKETGTTLAAQIEEYLGFFDADLQLTAQSIAGGNAKEIHRAAHRLVSHASIVKCEPLIQLACQLQAEAAVLSPSELAAFSQELQDAFTVLRQQLATVRLSNAPA